MCIRRYQIRIINSYYSFLYWFVLRAYACSSQNEYFVLEKFQTPDFYLCHQQFFTERSQYLKGLGIPLNLDSTLKGQSIFLAERASELLNDNFITDNDEKHG